MSLRINYNTSAFHALTNLQSADRMLQTSMTRLSSGVRISRAMDDPAGLTLANSMRHHLSGLTQASENAEEAVTMLQTAEGAMDEISNLLNKARELALGSANDGVNDFAQLEAYQKEFDNVIESITRIASTTRFGSTTLLAGGLSDNTLLGDAKDYYVGVTHDDTKLPVSIAKDSEITIGVPTAEQMPYVEAELYIDGSAPRAYPDPSTALNGLNQADAGNPIFTIAGGEQVRITGPAGQTTITLDPTTTIDDLVDEINTAGENIGVRARYTQSTGIFTVEATTQINNAQVSVDSDDLGGAGFLDSNPGVPTTNTLAGIRATGTELRDLKREEIRVTLETALATIPSESDVLNGLNQIGDGAGTLTITGGEQVNLTGPRGNTTISLQPNMTISTFVKLVNAQSESTGLRADYDETTGDLIVESMHYGSGFLSIDSDPLVTNDNGTPLDLTDDFGVGLLDSHAQNNLRNSFEQNRDSFSMSFFDTDAVLPVVISDPNTPIYNLRNGALPTDSIFDDVDGKTFTVYGKGESLSYEIEAPTTPRDIAEFLDSENRQFIYDDTAGTLEIFADDMVTSLGVLTFTPQIDMTALSDFVNGNGIPDTTDVFLQINNSRAEIVPWGITTSYTIDTLDPAALANFAATNIAEVTFNATGGNNSLGQITIDNTVDPAVTFDLDGDNDGAIDATIIDDMITFFETPTNRALMSNGFQSDGVTADILGVTSATPLATLDREEGTTIQDIMDFVNNSSDTTGAVAEFDTATGTLSMTGRQGSIFISSEDLTSANLSQGLLDNNTADLLVTNTQQSFDENASIIMNFTDANGQNHDVELVQIPGENGGRIFTNLLGGPTALYDLDPNPGPLFTGWEPGAFRVEVRELTDGSFGTTLAVSRVDAVAERRTTHRYQIGSLSNQVVDAEMIDMRAAALGHDAGLTNIGIRNLQDLVDRQSLISGENNEAVQLIDAAINEITNARGDLGAIQSNAIETSLTSLQIQIENLTNAESQIRDTDFAQESAELARHNIIYQAATSMLAQANQLPQSVLQLLQ